MTALQGDGYAAAKRVSALPPLSACRTRLLGDARPGALWPVPLPLALTN